MTRLADLNRMVGKTPLGANQSESGNKSGARSVAEAQERFVDLEDLRSVLETAFSSDTAQFGTTTAERPSAGHCAAVSVIVRDRFGGEMLSTPIAGQSHWFNRLRLGAELVDVDLTGDQFGFAAVRAVPAGELHENLKHRTVDELHVETLVRAIVLAGRAQLPDTARRLQHICLSRDETTVCKARSLAFESALFRRAQQDR